MALIHFTPLPGVRSTVLLNPDILPHHVDYVDKLLSSLYNNKPTSSMDSFGRRRQQQHEQGQYVGK
ncbi:hypothetical protein OUZ56_006902 [Daphnia magna]|uniref:Uncharacterized protein n=1 Tax=Daphnia magna TaxID=35525 RepID=A0ABQ9YX15_9CRUS|nr:hypothetical protein OUZ56_006902 [Daphnia magna]